MPSSSKKSVVVVGGGGAGGAVARTLSAKLDASKFSLTLVTARPFAIHLPAAIRMTTADEGHLENTVLISYDKLFVNNNGKLKIGRVASINDRKEGGGGGELVLTSGEIIYYDVLVLAPGSQWDGPLAFPDGKEETIAYINEWRRKFEAAQSIVLAGGGAVGIEYAGEIKDFWPKKKVTIVHAADQLLNKTYPDKFRKRTEKDVTVRGIEVVYNDYVDDFTQTGTVTTRNGKQIKADLVVPTHGNRPATEFISTLGSNVLNGRRQVKVRKTLQLESFNNIFACGDVIDWDEQKQVAKYAAHADVVASNVISVLSNAAPAKEYKGSPELIILTNGKKAGVAYLGFLWGIVLGNWFATMVKSKGLLIPVGRKGYGHAA